MLHDPVYREKYALNLKREFPRIPFHDDFWRWAAWGETLMALRDRLFARGEPDPAALRGGLEILRDADLRPTLSVTAQPALVIAGERDRLTPPEASRHMAQVLPRARLVEIPGAAHAPFLSHREAFVDALREFMKV